LKYLILLISCERDGWFFLEAVGEDEGGQDEEDGHHGGGHCPGPPFGHGQQEGEGGQHQGGARGQQKGGQPVVFPQRTDGGRRVGAPWEQVDLAPRDYLLLKDIKLLSYI